MSSALSVELIERVVRLEQQQAPLEVLATQMLAPLLEAVDARAGALLCYRRDEGSLALAAGRGLAAAAAQRLATVRWGGGGVWEMPLRALADRKAYTLDGGTLRTFATDLVGADDAATVQSIVAIPLHRWQQPVGVVLAIGDGPADLERILAHRLAYDVLAVALAAALWGGPRAAMLDVADAPPPSLVGEAWSDLRGLGFEAAAVSSGLGGDRAAIDAMLHDLRGAVDALRAERRLEQDERATLAERLAAAERERAEHAARTELLERELGRHEALLVEARRDLERGTGRALGDAATRNEADAGAAGEGSAAARTTAPTDAARTTTEASVDAVAAEGTSASVASATSAGAGSAPAAAPPTAAPAGAAPAHRVLESDAVRRDAITAALTRAIPMPSGRGLVVANLYDANAATLAELTTAATDGATIVGYAADATRSRILGGVRCFTDPPAPGEATAAVQPRAGKRMISLSDDIDAFIPAKAELAKLGYSVSMACDDKQAIDLLALLNPDAVLVDLRATPEAAASFVDALAPESGRILTLLVHGDPASGALRRALDRLMRPIALDANDLARVSRGTLASAPAARPAAVSAIRPVERGGGPVRRTATGG